MVFYLRMELGDFHSIVRVCVRVYLEGDGVVHQGRGLRNVEIILEIGLGDVHSVERVVRRPRAGRHGYTNLKPF